MGCPGAGGEIGVRASRAAMSRQIQSHDSKAQAAKGFGEGGQERGLGAPAVDEKNCSSGFSRRLKNVGLDLAVAADAGVTKMKARPLGELAVI